MVRTIVAGLVATALLVGTAFAEEIRGVLAGYDKETKTIKVKVGDEEKEYKLGDDIVIKAGQKELDREKFFSRLEKVKGKQRVVVVVEEGKVKEIRLAGGKGKGKKKGGAE